ncbi:MAG: phosphoribosylformylglycinamidine cyclo-ligase [Candidatus Caenarcaniphilales bacterium]|nr:phosphoribosylformylglycinamidine cyclo-ligase [Candidatus Caenarcaniphilales bacterium]
MESYLKSGVNIDEADSFVSELSKHAAKTFNNNVINGLGGFAGLFRLPQGLSNPVLVACTDGVGSKLKLAYENKKLENIGQDLVAMCLNDLLCSGAKPLFFLDYLATAKLDKEEALAIAKSIVKACQENDTVLLGGETAELPGMLPPKGYELAGFSVGIVEEEKILQANNCSEGDILLALPSSGLHSNGYSLVRSIIENNSLDLASNHGIFKSSLLYEVLLPTKIYTKAVNGILDKVNAIAHITGGGLYENLPRVFPKSLKAFINKDSWQVPAIFTFLQKHGNVDEQEMFRVFNMGIGLVLFVSKSNKDIVTTHLKSLNEDYYELGYLEKSPPNRNEQQLPPLGALDRGSSIGGGGSSSVEIR